MSIFTTAFWKDAAERAIKTAAQTAIVAGVGVAGFDAINGDWATIGGAALGGAILSILTSIGSDYATGGTGPSLVTSDKVEGA